MQNNTTSTSNPIIEEFRLVLLAAQHTQKRKKHRFERHPSDSGLRQCSPHTQTPQLHKQAVLLRDVCGNVILNRSLCVCVVSSFGFS